VVAAVAAAAAGSAASAAADASTGARKTGKHLTASDVNSRKYVSEKEGVLCVYLHNHRLLSSAVKSSHATCSHSSRSSASSTSALTMPRVGRSDEVLRQALRPQGRGCAAGKTAGRHRRRGQLGGHGHRAWARGGCPAMVLELRARDSNVASTTDRRHRQFTLL